MTSLSFTEAVDASLDSFLNRRPLANLSFALNYYFHGLQLPGYHVVNITIHVINGILLYFLLLKTLVLTNSSRNPAWIAGLSSLLWFVNPVQIQSVTYIVQRMTSLAALFFLCSLLFYIHSRQSRRRLNRVVWAGASAVSFALSVATKEWAWTLPAVIFFYEWFFFQHLNKKWFKKRAIYLLIGLGLSFIALYAVYGRTPISLLTSISQPRPFTPLERFFTEWRIIFVYMSLLLYPHPSRLNLNHDIPVSHGLFDPFTTLLSFLGLFVLVFLLLVVAKRGHRMAAFCLVWFLANLAIETLVADLELMFEHRIYVASMFFFVPFLLLLERKLKMAISLAAALAIVFGLWTYQRNSLWTQPVAFWQDSVEKAPDHYRSHFNLGTSYLDAKAYDRAIAAFEKSLTLSPPYPEDIYTNIGSAYIEGGNYDAARRNLTRALQLNPKIYIAHNLLGRLERETKNYPTALGHYEKAIHMHPNPYSYHGLGILYMAMERFDKASAAFQKALSLRPNWPEGHNSLGLAMAKQGNFDAAISILKKAATLDRENEEALFNLATAYKTVGRYEAAAETYTRLTEIDPGDIQALHNLGVIYYKHVPNTELARSYFSRALSLDPNYTHAGVIKGILNSLPPNRDRVSNVY